jgi:hypothetical protein
VGAVGVAHGVGQEAQETNVRRPAAAAGDAPQDLHHPLGADTAGGAAPAGLVLGEPLEIQAHIDDAGGVIEYDEAAAAQQGTLLPEGLGLQGQVHVLGMENAP